MTLTPDEESRYRRQIDLPEIGAAGQARLKRSRVLVVGVGGLGSPVAMYLAAAGVGRLGLIDADRVDVANLQRQVIHGTGAVGTAKVASAAARIADLNPNIDLDLFDEWLTPDNAGRIIPEYDIVVGCLDNFDARYLVNDVCAARRIPNVFGSAARFEGQASVFTHGDGPCYRCFFRDPPAPDWRPAALDKAVLGTAPGIIGCVQANEAIKIAAGAGDVLSGRLLLMDALSMRFRELRIRRDPQCPVCGASEEQP